MAKKAVNTFVSKMCARDLWNLCTRKHQSTQAFLTELLTIGSAEESVLKSIAARERVKHTVAAMWECCRYGWQQAAFGRKPNPTIATNELKCRRTRVLIPRAIEAGAKIADRQANAGA